MTTQFNTSAIFSELESFAEKNNSFLEGCLYEPIEILIANTEINSNNQATLINRMLTTEISVCNAVRNITNTKPVVANEILRLLKVRDYMDVPKVA